MNLGALNLKKFFKLIFSLILALLLIALVFFLINKFSNKKVVLVDNKPPEFYIISFSRRDLSEQKVLATFGRPSVIGLSDNAYRLKLGAEKFSEFQGLNIKYTVLPSDFVMTKNGFGLWKVEFVPPVYNSKVQSIANYGAIVQKNKDDSYLVWAYKDDEAAIDSLDTVEKVTGYFSDEKIDINLNSRLVDEKFNAKVKMLVINNDIEFIKNLLQSYGVNIIEEEGSSVIDSSLSTIVLNTNMNLDILKKITTSIPQLISVY